MKHWKRDLFCGATGAFIAGVFVASWYEFRSEDFTLVCQGVEMELRNYQDLSKVFVVYAARDIPSGTPVRLESLTSVRMEKAHCPANAIQERWIAVGRVSKFKIRKGQMLSFDDFGLWKNSK
jgi:hypothetical protein